jgi:hypothetical protein
MLALIEEAYPKGWNVCFGIDRRLLRLLDFLLSFPFVLLFSLTNLLFMHFKLPCSSFLFCLLPSPYVVANSLAFFLRPVITASHSTPREHLTILYIQTKKNLSFPLVKYQGSSLPLSLDRRYTRIYFIALYLAYIIYFKIRPRLYVIVAINFSCFVFQ